MITSWERDQLVKFIDQVMNVYHMGEFYKEYGTVKSSLYSWLRTSHIEDDLEVACHEGATKGVFVIPESDWVVKFRLIGEEHDYCEREYQNYLAAKAAGLEYYFAEILPLCERCGIMFYAQECVDCDESVDSSIVDKLQARYDSRGEEYDMDSLWCEVEDEMDSYERTLLLYDNEELSRFVHDNRINDLHCGNFGIKGDRYVMIDFSGFGSQVFMDKPE